MAEEKKTVENHILLVAMASQGHINPMLHLARRLARKGLHVTIATTEVARDRMIKSNISPKISSSIHLEFFSNGLSSESNRSASVDHIMDSLEEFGPLHLSNLIDSLCTSRLFSCVVHDPFMPWAADVAEKHGIPCAMHWIQPCAVYAIFYHYYNKSTQPLTVPNLELELGLDYPGLPLLDAQDLPSFLLPSNPFHSIPKLLSNVFNNLQKVKWVLGNSFYELEQQVIKSMTGFHPIIPIGPLISSEENGGGGMDMWKSEDACIDWLDKKPDRSVIYVSFGSLGVLPAQQMENIATGLKKSNHPFLWVAKPPNYKVADRSSLVSSAFLEETKEKGLVVPWCNQTEVLNHPAIACFVSHCGWNSVLEAVVAGVPMVAWPLWADQPTNAKLVVDGFEVGVRVRAGDDGIVSAEEVERCIGEVFDGLKSVELKNKAMDWKKAAREAAVEGGSSDRNLQMFVDEMLLNNAECA